MGQWWIEWTKAQRSNEKGEKRRVTRDELSPSPLQTNTTMSKGKEGHIESQRNLFHLPLFSLNKREVDMFCSGLKRGILVEFEKGRTYIFSHVDLFLSIILSFCFSYFARFSMGKSGHTRKTNKRRDKQTYNRDEQSSYISFNNERYFCLWFLFRHCMIFSYFCVCDWWSVITRCTPESLI